MEVKECNWCVNPAAAAILPANGPIHSANYACKACAIDTVLSVVDRPVHGEVLADRIAQAVVKFLRTDEDTRLALAHIFEGDGPELFQDIRRVVGEELHRPSPREQ